MNLRSNLAARRMVLVFGLSLCAASYSAATEVAIDGVCPGDVTFRVSNAIPNAQVALAWSPQEGMTTIPGGPCVGLELGLDTVNQGSFLSADANGEVSLTLNFGGEGGCGVVVQGIDMGDCTATPVNRIPGVLEFTDVTASAGVLFEQFIDTSIPIGGGAIWADFNGDDWDDLYLTQGDGCNRLYLNQQDGTFSESVDAAGASSCLSTSHAAAVADYDNDGDQDIYVSNNGPNQLFQNRLIEDGTLAFVDRTVAAGMNVAGMENSSSAAWGDFDNDGNLDLVVLQHFVPVLDDCIPDLLWHSNGDGTFSEVASSYGLNGTGAPEDLGCGLAVTWSDFDRDGDQDLMVVNDLGAVHVPNQLFRNEFAQGQNTFTNVSVTSGFDYQMFGMGIAAGDFERDGFFDYYMTDRGPSKFAYNNGDGTFTDIAVTAGVEAWDPDIYLGDDGLVSWGTLFSDSDLDGWLDLTVANGGSPEEYFPGMFGDDYIETNPIFFYRNNLDETFNEVHQDVGIVGEKYYRTIAGSDYDRDGDVDFYAGVGLGFGDLYRNDYPTGILNWLEVNLKGTVSNRDGIGALVEVTIDGETQMREVSGGASFLSRHSLTSHFGLGDYDTVDRLLVTFPSGLTVEQLNVAANQIVTVVEPAE